MKLVYLGTSGAMPTIDRGLSCTVLALDHHYIMVDCGDGSCRQFLKSNLKWNKPMTILITHMHTDHTMGLLGLLLSMDLMGRTAPINIYGVRGLKQFLHDVKRSSNLNVNFPVTVEEIEHGAKIVGDGFTIETCSGQHQVPVLAYKITLPPKAGKLDIEKCKALGVPDNHPMLGQLKSGQNVSFMHTISHADGREETKHVTVLSSDVVAPPTRGLVIAFSGDTRPTHQLGGFFYGVDYLTHETTFRTDELELAKTAKHSTAEEVGKLCELYKVKTLLANHFSARHASTEGFYKDIKQHYHGKIICTRDLLEVELK